MFDKPLPFFIRVWYYKTQKRMYVLKMCSKEMGGLIMANAAGTAQKMRRRKENHKFSRMMAVILGLIVTVEVMIAGGMIFNIDFLHGSVPSSHLSGTIPHRSGFLWIRLVLHRQQAFRYGQEPRIAYSFQEPPLQAF